MTANPKPLTPFQKAKALILRKRAERKKVIDERYRDMSDCEESEQDRTQRILNDGTAWTDIT